MHVKLTYFKQNGKYYSEGEHESPYKYFHQAVAEIKCMLDAGKRPGLIDGHDFHVLVMVYTEDGPLPFLFTRGANLENHRG